MPDAHSLKPPLLNDDTRRAFLHGDREDLLAVLTLRFGAVPEPVQARIATCDDATTLERLILVAANVPDWDAFLCDLSAGPQAFRLVGASYEPNASESGAMTAPRGTDERRLPGKARPKEE